MNRLLIFLSILYNFKCLAKLDILAYLPTTVDFDINFTINPLIKNFWRDNL